MDFSKYGIPSKEWLAFAARSPAAAQDGFSGNDPLQASQLRQAVNTAREATSDKLMTQSGLKDRVHICTLSIPSRAGRHSIPLRRFSPLGQHGRRRQSQDPVRGLVYFHGGGFLFGSETTDDYLCATIAETLGVVVLSVIYRHTPDWPHPAQHDDAQDALAYIEAKAPALGIDRAGGVGVLGISAGANLATAAVRRDLELSQGGSRMIRGAVLSIPWLFHVDNYPFDLFTEHERSAKVQCRDAPVIPWPRLKLFSDLISAGGGDNAGDNPLLNAALVSDARLSDWPRTGLLVAGMDPLRDDGLLLAKRLEALGVPTSVYVFPGLPHGFRRWADLPASGVFDTRMLDSIRWAMGLDDVDGMEGWHEYKEQ